MMLLFISFSRTRTDMSGSAARGAIRVAAPLHQQSYRARERQKKIDLDDTNVILEVLEDVFKWVLHD